MAEFPELVFPHTWLDAEHFPTHESNETKVRQDLQELHDIVKNYLNGPHRDYVDESIAQAVISGIATNAVETKHLADYVQRQVLAFSATVTLSAENWSNRQYVIGSAAIEAGLAPGAYDGTKPYAVGDYCVHNKEGVPSLWRCNTPITAAEPWTPEHWTDMYMPVPSSLVTGRTDIVITVPTDATTAQKQAFARARLFCVQQGGGNITLQADGVTPTVALPITLIFRGDVLTNTGAAPHNNGPTGDMLAADYDPSGKVLLAGGVPGWTPKVIVTTGSPPTFNPTLHQGVICLVVSQ